MRSIWIVNYYYDQWEGGAIDIYFATKDKANRWVRAALRSKRMDWIDNPIELFVLDKFSYIPTKDLLSILNCKWTTSNEISN